MTRTEVKALAAALSADADVLIAAVEDYTRQTLEPEVVALRTRIAELLPEIDLLWGAEGMPLRVALVDLASRLADLLGQVQEGAVIVSITTDRETSLIELAIAQYGDWTRYTEIGDLNRMAAADPSRIRAGTTMVLHAA